MAKLTNASFVSDVTAVHLLRLGNRSEDIILLAGCGSQLLVYRLHDGKRLAVHRVLNGSRIHGIASLSNDAGSFPVVEASTGTASAISQQVWSRCAARAHVGATPAPATTDPFETTAVWVVVYGDRWVDVLHLQVQAGLSADVLTPTGTAHLRSAVRLPTRPAWVLSASLLHVEPHGQESPQTVFDGERARVSAGFFPPQDDTSTSTEDLGECQRTLNSAPTHSDTVPVLPLSLALVLVLSNNSAEVWRLQQNQAAAVLAQVPSANMAATTAARPPQVAQPWDPHSMQLIQAPGPGLGTQHGAQLDAVWVLAAQCESQMQLFSAAALPLRVDRTGETRLWIAAGTVFNDVLLWQLPPLPPATPAASSTDRVSHHQGPTVGGDNQTETSIPSAAAMDRTPFTRARAGCWPHNLPADPNRLRCLASRYDRLEAALRLLETRCKALTDPGPRQPHQHHPDSLPAMKSTIVCPAQFPLRVRSCVRYMLKGHEGSVFHVEWVSMGGNATAATSNMGICVPTLELENTGSSAGSASTWALLSSSDDRSARLWLLPDLARSSETPSDLDVASRGASVRGATPSPRLYEAPLQQHTASSVQPAVEAATNPWGLPGAPSFLTGPPMRGPVVVAPVRTLWGHTSRVWCCTSLGTTASAGTAGANACSSVMTQRAFKSSAVAQSWDVRRQEVPLVVVTGSEDCSARVWDVGSGKCLTVLQGHRGRGIWHCAVLPPPGGRTGGGPGVASGGTSWGGVLVTAGADAAVRVWDLDLRELLPIPGPVCGSHLGNSGSHGSGATLLAGGRGRGFASDETSSAPAPAGSTAQGWSAVSMVAGCAAGGLVHHTFRLQHLMREPTEAPPPQQQQQRKLEQQKRQQEKCTQGLGTSKTRASLDGARVLAFHAGGRVLLAGTYSGCVDRVYLPEPGLGGPQPAAGGDVGISRSGFNGDVREPRTLETRAYETADLGNYCAGRGRTAATGKDEQAWERLYDNATQGACTCLEVCPLAPASIGTASLSGRSYGCSSGGQAAAELVAVGHSSGCVSVLELPAASGKWAGARQQPLDVRWGQAAATDRECASASCVRSKVGNAGGSYSSGDSAVEGGGRQVDALHGPHRCVDGAESVGVQSNAARVLCSWRATRTGAVIGAWWVAALGRQCLLTVGGDTAAVRIWRLRPMLPLAAVPSKAIPRAEAVLAGDTAEAAPVTTAPSPLPEPTLLAIAASPLRGRLLVADVCRTHRVLLAGDQYGNLVGFWAPPTAWEAMIAEEGPESCDNRPCTPTDGYNGKSAASGIRGAVDLSRDPHRLPCIAVFRTAVGPSAVSWIRLQAPDPAGIFVVAGREGVLALFRCYAGSWAAHDAASPTAAPVALCIDEQSMVTRASGYGDDDIHAAAATSGASAPVLLECLGSQSRTGITCIELAIRGMPSPYAAGISVAADAVGAAAFTAEAMTASLIRTAVPGVQGADGGLLVAGFHGADFLAVALSPDPSELLRVPSCGGWRRTHALHVGAAGDISFAYIGGGERDSGATAVHVVQKGTRRAPPSPQSADSDCQVRLHAAGESQQGVFASSEAGAARSLPSSLHVGHHGREVLCVCMLPAPAQPPLAAPPGGFAAPEPLPPPICILTGAEDGSIRRVTSCPVAANAGGGSAQGSSYSLCFEDGALVGEHAAGTAVRCLAACKLSEGDAALLGMHPGGGGAGRVSGEGCNTARTVAAMEGGGQRHDVSYLVISAGAKEVLMAWLVTIARMPPLVVSPPQLAPSAAPTSASCSRGASAVPQYGGASGPPADPLVTSRWLSTRPPRQGLRPMSLRVSQPTISGDRRYLALALLGVATAQASSPKSDAACLSTFTSPATQTTALLAVSSSDASVSLQVLELYGSRAWRTAAHLKWHQHPVLSMAQLTMPPTSPALPPPSLSAVAIAIPPFCAATAGDVDARGGAGEAGGTAGSVDYVDISCSHGGVPTRSAFTASVMDSCCDGQSHGGISGAIGEGYWLATGDTAGSVALWWVPSALHGGYGDTIAAVPGDAASSTAGTTGADGSAPLRPDPPILHPVLVVRGLHQSGVNALAMARCSTRTPPVSSSPQRFTKAPQGGHSCSTRDMGLVLVSGGDDQALAVLRLKVSSAPEPFHAAVSHNGDVVSDSGGMKAHGEALGGEALEHVAHVAVAESPGQADVAPADTEGSSEESSRQRPGQPASHVGTSTWRAQLLGLSLRPMAHASALRGVELCSGGACGAPSQKHKAADSSYAQMVTSPAEAGSLATLSVPESPGRDAAAEDYVTSVGLDQVLRLWRLQEVLDAGPAVQDPPLHCPAGARPQAVAESGVSTCAQDPSPERRGSRAARVALGHEAQTRGTVLATRTPGGGTSSLLSLVQCDSRSVRVERGFVGQVSCKQRASSTAQKGNLEVECLGGSSSCDFAGHVAQLPDVLLAGEAPLIAEPLAASVVEVPEPACLSTIALPHPATARVLPRYLAQMDGSPVLEEGSESRIGFIRAAGSSGVGSTSKAFAVPLAARTRLAAAVAGRGLQLMEGQW